MMSYVFSQSPVEADFHVIYHKKTKMIVPNDRNRIAFVITEPPEIETIKLEYLEQFGVVFTPEFDYLKDLQNIEFSGGLLPWQAGFTFNNGEVVQNRTLDEIVNSWCSERPILLSVITSDKKLTPQQKQRLDFIAYLKSEIRGVEVFGRGFNEIDDKAEVLLKSRYHLALENSSHNGYWTEKFIDPLICGTQIIYAGDKSLHAVFDSFEYIDLDDFAGSKDKIKKKINENLWALNQTKRRNDYLKFMDSCNLFATIEKWATGEQSASVHIVTKVKAEESRNVKFIRRVVIFARFRIRRLMKIVLNMTMKST